MAINPSPNFIPNQAIPNNPFYSPQAWNFVTSGGSLIFGSGFLVNATTGYVQNAPGPIPPGTVTSITAGIGIVTSPVGAIINTGSISLAPVGGSLVPGTYTYTTLTVDTYGRVTTAINGVTPVQSVVGVAPIIITGSAPSVSVGITPATTTASGSVQLRDDLVTPSSDLALTALQGYILNQQVGAIASTAGNQYLAGTFNAATGLLVSVTAAGTANTFAVGANLPTAVAAGPGAYVIVTTAGSYNPPGGGGPYAAVSGDQFLTDGASYFFIASGFRPTYATTSIPGIVELATPAEVVPLTNNTLAVTPFSLSTMIASTTQKGFAELATDAETLALTDATVVVTPSNLNILQASTSQRGLVQLSDDINSTSTTQAATANALRQVNDLIIPKTIITAKGDLIVGQSNGVPAILPQGSNGSVLTVDTTKPLGLDWTVPGATNTVPVGVISWFTTSVAANLPVGWVVCDGSSYPNTVDLSPGVPNPYYDLFDIIGSTYGSAGATFQVPDLRGLFVRGWNNAGGTPGLLDPGRAFASIQTSAVQTHIHPVQSLTHTHGVNVVDPGHNHEAASATVVGGSPGYYPGNDNFGTTTPQGGPGNAGFATTGISASAGTGLVGPDGTYNTLINTAPTPTNETRPVSIALLPIIKYSSLYD